MVTQATAANSKGASYSGTGSVAVNVYDNTSHATVESGAQIDQDTTLQDAAQAVDITASTTIQIVDMAGIGKWSLNDGAVLNPLLDKKFADLKSGDNYVNLYGSAGTTALGGSILVTSITDNTVALIDPGAVIHSGTTGGLTVGANETIFRIEIAQAGGLAGSSGGSPSPAPGLAIASAAPPSRGSPPTTPAGPPSPAVPSPSQRPPAALGLASRARWSAARVAPPASA